MLYCRKASNTNGSHEKESVWSTWSQHWLEANEVTLCVNHSQIKKTIFKEKKKSQSLKSEMFCHLNYSLLRMPESSSWLTLAREAWSGFGGIGQHITPPQKDWFDEGTDTKRLSVTSMSPQRNVPHPSSCLILSLPVKPLHIKWLHFGGGSLPEKEFLAIPV